MKESIIILESQHILEHIATYIETNYGGYRITNYKPMEKKILTMIFQDLISTISNVQCFSLCGLTVDEHYIETKDSMYNSIYKELEHEYSSIIFNYINTDIYFDIIVIGNAIHLYITRVY